MPSIYLTPASLSYLTQTILTLAVTGYFLYRLKSASQWLQTALLCGFFAAIAVFSLLLMLEAALPGALGLYALFLQNTIVGGALICILQFAYRFPFPHSRFRWEAWTVLAISVVYTAWEAGFAVYRFGLLRAGQVIYRPPFADYPMALEFLWTPIILLRQSVHASAEAAGASSRPFFHALWHPVGRAARAARALALVYLMPFGLSLLNILAARYVISREAYHVSLSLGTLFAIIVFGLVYLNHLPETTSFVVKLAGVTLLLMLSVFGTLGWVIAPLYAAQYWPDLPARKTIRFLPNNAGGYDLTSEDAHFERPLGSRIELSNIEELWSQCFDTAFEFPFYGQTYPTICVTLDGALSMGQPIRYSHMRSHYGGGAPVIVPLFLELSAKTHESGVFVRQTENRLIVTWNRMASLTRPHLIFTFQVILERSGVFAITYDELPESAIFGSNEDPGNSPWFIGIAPGSLTQPPEVVADRYFPETVAAQGFVHNYYLAFRHYLHQVFAPLAFVIIVSSFLVLLGLPVILYANLVRPLNALLNGVRQMNAGHYGVHVAVQYPDEIGFLTRVFNTMTATLQTLIHNLEARVAERTRDLALAKALAEENSRAAEAANRAKSTFLASMSHELRTPLNVILGFAQILAREPHTAEEGEYFTLIQRSGKHLLTLINQVLDLSKIEAGRMTVNERQFDLYRVLDELKYMFALRAQHKHLDVIVEHATDVPRNICADDVKLRQILINLLNNAIKFTNEGCVVVRISHVEGEMIDAQESQSSGSSPPASLARVKFEVSDTGPGIRPEDIDTVFEAFAQTSAGLQAQEGTGLGLPISRKFARLMGGDLTVESTVGQGATFAFVIPVKVVDVPESAEKSMPPDVIGIAPNQPQYRMLIVDDNSDNRRLMTTLLQPFGCALRTAGNGAEALDIWKSWQPDLIWMDVRMPGMSGYEVTRRIRADSSADAPVIIAVSASSFEDEETDARSRGCDDFLRKPFQIYEVVDLLRKHLRMRFVYVKKPQPARDIRRATPVAALTPEALASLPEDVWADLKQAVDTIDIDATQRCINWIRKNNEPLAETLAELVEGYRFDTLQEWFEHVGQIYSQSAEEDDAISPY